MKRFPLHIAPDALPEVKIAAKKYIAAVEGWWAAKGATAYQEALTAMEKARRNFGFMLLRQDRRRRPHIYAK